MRKIRASNELWHHFLGTVDTPEKFNDQRAILAQYEWERIKATDSRECRICHTYDSMDYGEQGRQANAAHSRRFAEGRTCIDCHKGLAHAWPPIEQNIGERKTSTAH